MDIAVVDDEKAIREHICGMVKEQQPESRIEAYATGGELLASGKRFDIVFLDIQMEGMNGIEAARSLREKQGDTVLVFVTGIRDYVFDAFDLYAFQYLLKPIDEDKFAEVLARAVREAAKKKERRVLFIKSRNLTLDQSEIVNVSDEMKQHVYDDVKKAFYKYGGMSGDNTAETDAYYDKIHSYVKSLDLSTRRAAPWTLSRLHLEIAGRATQAVKEKDPTWTAGQPVSHEILDEVFAGDTIFQDSVNALCSKGSNGLDVKI